MRHRGTAKNRETPAPPTRVQHDPTELPHVLRSDTMRKKSIGATAVALGVAGVTLLGTGSAGSHGYTDSPISRQKLCANGTVSNCGNIQWEPQSVEGLKGFPAAGPADGKICAGGNGPFAQ